MLQQQQQPLKTKQLRCNLGRLLRRAATTTAKPIVSHMAFEGVRAVNFSAMIFRKHFSEVDAILDVGTV